jgi:hypothetical protein
MTSSNQTCGNCNKCEFEYLNEYENYYSCMEFSEDLEKTLLILELGSVCFFNPSRWEGKK